MEKNSKKKLLLHSCCGPCSTAVLEKLYPDWDISVYYYNPNIGDAEEYALRLSEQARFLFLSHGDEIPLIEGEYEPEEYYNRVRGLEQEPEGEERCRRCFLMRLESTARRAAEGGYDAFDSTMSVSPHKNYGMIREIGAAMQSRYGVQYLGGNYKKGDGYKKSVNISRRYGLYRQDYCGCVFSLEEAKQRRSVQSEEELSHD